MDTAPAKPLGWAARTLLVLLAVASFTGLISLGVWQLQRLSWKLDLIARTERMLVAAAVAAPGPADWPLVAAESAYRRVHVEGEFRHDLEACTQAVTDLGPGCWVITPLQTSDGWWLLVNRGFVELSRRDAKTRPTGQVAGTVAVEGLLRLNEPGGGFLRRNDPANNRWYSRDVTAIAAARGLPASKVAPYFVDVATTALGGPIGGLTVVRFHNSHLVYALTWFGLALMVPVGAWLVIQRERKLQLASRP